MQANTIIKAVLRKLQVIPGGGTPSAQQYADGLEVLNDLVNSWSANKDLTYEDTFEELTIPASTQSITIGSTGTLVTARPLEITLASLKTGDIEYPLTIIGKKVYQDFSNKAAVSQPYRIYYRNTWPNGTIYFESTTDQEYTLILTSLKQISTFPDGTTEVSLPDFYEKALKDNLLIELAPEMGSANRITQLMVRSAEESKLAIIGQSLDITPSVIEVRSEGSYNIEADDN